jgi:DNA-binding beta-propeller fold protein YncE
MTGQLVLMLFTFTFFVSSCRSVPLDPSFLKLVSDTSLPGNSTRFDYQDVDGANGHLILAHMGDGAVTVVNLSDGSLVKRLPGIPTARGVVVASSVDRIFITSAPDQLVIFEARSLKELARVKTGAGPDGVSWDTEHCVVAVSDQHDGALSLIPESGLGIRRQVPLGTETGNVVFDAQRKLFWITVVGGGPHDQLVSVNPLSATVTQRIELPGCTGAHGLRLHPDSQSAFIACEGNSKLVRVQLETQELTLAATGRDPDVLAFDGAAYLYVAAESGEVSIFDITKPGLSLLGKQQVADHAHSVAVDEATHRVYFPLMRGANETPTLRSMIPRRL